MGRPGAGGRAAGLSLREAFWLPLVALEFLTVLRLRRPALVSDRAFGSSQAFFPLVGLLLGGLAASLDWALRSELGPGLSGWLLMGLLLALTGGLHADGLADTADGLFGAWTRERRLEVMRDSAVGAYGAAALVLVFGAKAAALGALAPDSRAEALILAPALSRWACVAAIAAIPYARAEGLGLAFHGRSLPWAAPLAGVVALMAAVVALGPEGAAAWGLAGALGLGLGVGIASRLGGMTGDGYGAVVEVTELVLLCGAVAWLG